MLHNRHELHITATDIFHELVHLQSPTLRSLVDGRHGIELYTCLAENDKTLDNFFKCRITSLVFSELVVDISRTIDRDPQKEIVLSKEVCSFAGYHGTICLQSVVYDLAVGILFLELYSLFVEIQAHDKRLTAMPVEGHLRDIICSNILLGERFKHLQTHSSLSSTINLSLIKIIAVMTVEITQRTRRLNHEIKSQRAL